MFTYLCIKFSFLRETKIFTSFFDKAPFLYIALFALFGALFGKTSDPLFLIPLLPLFFHRIRLILVGLVIFFLFYSTHSMEEKITLDEGSGIFSIEEVQAQKGFLVLRGKLHYWNGEALNRQSMVRVKRSEEERIKYHKRLFIKGSIKQKAYLTLYPKEMTPNSPSRFSLPWLRFYMKHRLQKSMEKGHRNGAILSSLLFGSEVPKQIASSIKRFGLSHLFAISGFHFNLITSLLAMLLRPCVSYRIFHWVILTLLTGYAFLIGPNPSLLRGFLAQAILFLGLALGKSSVGLNSLGAGLFVITLFFPHLMTHLGFIFSFVITFTLLLLYPLVSRLLPKKPAWLVGPIALLLTVELASFPLNLVLFGSYPLLSPLYNLFVTPLISLTLFFAPLTCVPYLSHLIYLPMDIALWTFELPPGADLFLHYRLSPLMLTVYLTLLFTIGIFASRGPDLNDPLLPVRKTAG